MTVVWCGCWLMLYLTNGSLNRLLSDVHVLKAVVSFLFLLENQIKVLVHLATEVFGLEVRFSSGGPISKH